MSQHVSDLIRRWRLLLSYKSPSLTHTLFCSLTSSQTDVNVVIVGFNIIFNTAASFHIAVFIKWFQKIQNNLFYKNFSPSQCHIRSIWKWKSSPVLLSSTTSTTLHHSRKSSPSLLSHQTQSISRRRIGIALRNNIIRLTSGNAITNTLWAYCSIRNNDALFTHRTLLLLFIKSVKWIAQPVHMEAKILSRAAFDDDVFYYASSFREIFPLADAIDLLPPFFYVASV